MQGLYLHKVQRFISQTVMVMVVKWFHGLLQQQQQLEPAVRLPFHKVEVHQVDQRLAQEITL